METAWHTDRNGVRSSSAYHPQTDGQSERINQILEDYLRMYVSHRQDDWVQWIPLAEFAYNNRRSSTTELSPFEIWYSEHPNISVSIPKKESVPAAKDMASKISAINKEVKAMISISQERYKEQADKHKLPDPVFAVGDKV